MSVAGTSSTSSTMPSTPPSPTASGTGWPKLSPGEIPSTWSKPAEVVTTLPVRAKPSSSAGPVVGVVVALATAAVVFVALPKPRGDDVTPAGSAAVSAERSAAVSAERSAAVAARASAIGADARGGVAPPASRTAREGALGAIPAPPPTSSTTPAPVAPEDQGGDLVAPVVATSPAFATASPAVPAPAAVPALPDARADDPPLETGGVTELPARKKAKALTARAIRSLKSGDVASAEPVLVRAVLIDPSHADGWRHLGITRAQLGDLDGARRAYRKYLELAPTAADAAQVRAILAQ